MESGCITIPPASITQFTCCPIPQGETSGITPTYNWLNSELQKRVVSDDPSEDINGFVIENNTQDSNFCDGDSVVGGNMCVPQSDVRLEYTRPISAIITPSSPQCDSSFTYTVRRNWRRLKIFCDGSPQYNKIRQLSLGDVSTVSQPIRLSFEKSISYNEYGDQCQWDVTFLPETGLTITAETSSNCHQPITRSITVQTPSGHSFSITKQRPTIPCEESTITFLTYNGNACDGELALYITFEGSGIDPISWSSSENVSSDTFVVTVPENTGGATALTITITATVNNEDYTIEFEIPRESCVEPQNVDGCCIVGHQDLDNYGLAEWPYIPEFRNLTQVNPYNCQN